MKDDDGARKSFHYHSNNKELYNIIVIAAKGMVGGKKIKFSISGLMFMYAIDLYDTNIW